MKQISLILCLIFIQLLCFSQINKRWEKIIVSEDKTICNDSPWILVFEDNFEGKTLEINKWKACIGVPRDPNFKYQKAWHKSENVVVEDGLLKLVSKQEQNYNMPIVTNWDPYTVTYDDFEYTSGEIWTKPTFTFGKLEARLKIPKEWGFCPAFWMFGNPPWNEIDVFEFYNEKKRSNLAKIQHISIHYNGKSRSTSHKGNDFSTDFHLFTMIWDENKISFYVDGKLLRTDYKYKKGFKKIECQLYAGKKYKKNKIFTTEPMHIILNIAVLSDNRAPDNTTTFPTVMEVDYVRFYQRKETDDLKNKVIHSVQTQIQTYPKSTLKDIYKNLFQDRFGTEHAIDDTTSAQLFLKNELASFENSNCLEIEYLGINNNYVRINLSAVKQDKISQEKLFKAFSNSAKRINENDIETWQSDWGEIVKIIEQMNLDITDFENDKNEIDSLLKQGKYSVHHSSIFNKTYQPHYRIVEKNIFEQELKPYL